MAYKNIDLIPENVLTPLESIFQAAYKKIPGKKTGGLLSIKVQFNGETFPSPESLASDDPIFRSWVRERLEFAHAQKYDISHAVNLIRKYDGHFGWFVYKRKHEAPPAQAELTIYDE